MFPGKAKAISPHSSIPAFSPLARIFRGNLRRGSAPFIKAGLAPAALVFFFLTAVQAGWGLPSTPAVTPVKNNQTSTDNLTVSPQEEIQVLDAIDALSNTPTPAAAVLAAPATSSGPPPVPTGLKLLTLKEGVYLSWNSAPESSPVASYNVYRSTVPGGDYRLMNLKPITAPYYLDGVLNSVTTPKNGENYFYVVSSVDSRGNVSAYSEEGTVAPTGMEIPLTEEEKREALKPKATPTPEEERVLDVPQQKIINLQLPADTQLSIQGYKKIEAVFSFQHFNRKDQPGLLADNNNTQVNQELVVNLQGKVGKNVDVNVDYSDVNRNNGVAGGGVDQSKQNISIVYHGNEDSPIQEVAFGDLQLYLPNTEFAGFSKQLFGLQAKLRLDRFRFTSFFAQTKGISETKVFKGNYVQVKKDIQDIEYMRYRYFLITRGSNPVTVGTQIVNNALPLSNSEEIWVDPANGIFPDQSNPKIYRGFYEHWLPGKDYTIDYSTGVITFLRALSLSSKIAVAYVDQNHNTVGFDPTGAIDLTPATLQVPVDGIVTNAAHLIKDNVNPTDVSPLYLLNYFDLGRDKIVPPQQDPEFLFQVIDQGTNNVLQTGAAGPWSFQVNQDLNLLTVTNTSVTFSAPPYFPERPFANIDSSGGTASNDVYSQTSPPISAKRIHMEYKTKLDFYRLDRFNIIRGSEAVYLDGRRLNRDADYFFDYNSGFLDFQDKSLLRPDSQVVVTYEYAPFGSFGQNNILGARAEYDLTDHFFLGSTFLYTTTQQPNEVPQIGSTPNSLAVLDADAKVDISPEDIQSVTGVIPGLENWKPPLNIKLSAEVAQSYFSPDTFSAEGESGVGMVDNMEGIDNATGPSTNPTSWLVSSQPKPVLAFLPGLTPNAAQTTTNNRVRFYNPSAPITLLTDFQMIGTQNGTGGIDYTPVPAYGGHTYAASHDGKDVVSVLQFPYSHLSNQTWAGLRQVLSPTGTDLSTTRYFQTWICNDGVDKWVMFDFGIINEDSNGNTPILDHDPNQGSTNLSDPSYGIPTFYALGTPWNVSSPGPGALFDPATNGFVGYQGEVSQEGVSTNLNSNTTYLTEDMNGNGVMDGGDSYFEYGVRVNWPVGQWRQVKIPVNFAASDGMNLTSDGISYFNHSYGTPNAQIVRAFRVWATGTTSSEVNGDFWIENISFTRNLWQLQVDPDAAANMPGIAVNNSKFDVTSISHEQEPDRYDGVLRFLTVASGQDQTAILNKEKSLKITYNLSTADFYTPVGSSTAKPIYYATRLYNQGLDFTDYQELRMDLQIKSFRPGEVLFIRLGNDQNNFYQYNVQLTDQYLSTWNTLVIPLDGSGGNRSKVGTPYLNRSSQISFGVLAPISPTGQIGELWINNLRTANAASRSGVARRVNAAFNLGDNFATLNTRYREVDSGFTQMDQTSTHFQHSRQLGADFNSSAFKLFGQPVVSDFHATRQDTTTEEVLKQNPYYLALPDTKVENLTGSLSYTKDLGPNLGRLTTVRVSGSTNEETDYYLKDYLAQPGVQGNTKKDQELLSVNSTYDAPPKLFFLNIGTNQFNQSFSLTHDRQDFLSVPAAPALPLANYDRTTRVQNYGWTNTTELVKNLVFTPGYSLSLTDAMGNTNSPGVQGAPIPSFTPFQQGYKPKLGLVFHGINGVTPQIDYSGSNQFDFVSFPDGTRFNNANSLNYSFNLSPGTWLPLLQQMGVTVSGGRTENFTETIPDYDSIPGHQALTFQEKYLTWANISSFALTGTKSIAHQLNGSFKLFDVWEFKPTGAWNEQESVLSKGAHPIRQNGRTLGLTTNYTKRIFTVPLVNFNLNSAQFQFTRTENNQFDSSDPPIIDTQTNSDLYSFTFPYDINQKAQGNIRIQRTTGLSLTRQTQTHLHDDQGVIEYTQKFAPNLEIHIPFTKWKLKLQDAIELRSTFSVDFVENDSNSVYNQLKTQKYRGTIDLTYNALKNLKVGIGLANEYFFNTTYELSSNYDPTDESKKNHTFDYTLWQGTVSVEARF